MSAIPAAMVAGRGVVFSSRRARHSQRSWTSGRGALTRSRTRDEKAAIFSSNRSVWRRSGFQEGDPRQAVCARVWRLINVAASRADDGHSDAHKTGTTQKGRERVFSHAELGVRYRPHQQSRISLLMAGQNTCSAQRLTCCNANTSW